MTKSSVDLTPTNPTPEPSPEAHVTRSRRSLLAGAAGALAGIVGTRLATPDVAAAANGDALKLGQTNAASATTSLTMTSQQGLKLAGTYEGLVVVASASGGMGLKALATNTAGKTLGIYGHAFGPDGVGVKGISSQDGAGVVGQSYLGDFGSPMPNQPKTGVYGYADRDSTAIGVAGRSTSGLGVKGKATSGSGVYGTTDSGFGVIGFGGTGVGGFFQSGSAMVGVALQTVGRVKFDKSVGRATIAAGANRVTVTPGLDLNATSAVVATLQGSAGGAVVERVSVDTTANTFTIWLTKNATLAAPVAWHVFG